MKNNLFIKNTAQCRLDQDLNVQIEVNTVIYEEDGSVGYETQGMRCTILK